MLAPLVVVLATMTGVVGGASPAWAAAPSNDDATGAQVINSFPYHFEEDPTEATTSADEDAIHTNYCGAPRLEHGVWFTSTTDAAGDVVLDVTHSDFSAGIAVFAIENGTPSFITCAHGQIRGSGVPGVTFYLLVFGDGGFDGNQPTSGHLVFDVRPPVAPPVITMTVDKFASVDKQSTAHVTGTVRCTADDGQGIVFGAYLELRQSIGRILLYGSASTVVGAPCDGVSHPWQIDVSAFNGKFAGGKAASVSLSYGCGTDSCSDSGWVNSTIQLRRNGN